MIKINHPMDYFKGLRVLEIAGVLAGPAVGKFFAELGATVIKVENARSGGDVTRKWKNTLEDKNADQSAYWWSINLGKTIEMLDFRSAADMLKLHEWIASSDVVITNFRKKTASKYGLTPEVLMEQHPGLIIGNITGYGENDDRPAFDVLLQAETGWLSMTGHEGEPPAKLPVALIDILCGHQLKEGVLLALLKKERTGQGSIIQVSLFDSAVSALANQANNWLMSGFLPQPIGTAHPNIAPYGDSFQTSSGDWLVLAVGTDKQFNALMHVLQLDSKENLTRYKHNAERLQLRSELNALLQAVFLKRDINYWLETLSDADVPISPIRNLAQLFELEAAKRLIMRASDGLALRTAVFEFKNDNR